MITPDLWFFSASPRLCGRPTGTGAAAEIFKAPPGILPQRRGDAEFSGFSFGLRLGAGRGLACAVLLGVSPVDRANTPAGGYRAPPPPRQEHPLGSRRRCSRETQGSSPDGIHPPAPATNMAPRSQRGAPRRSDHGIAAPIRIPSPRNNPQHRKGPRLASVANSTLIARVVDQVPRRLPPPSGGSSDRCRASRSAEGSPRPRGHQRMDQGAARRSRAYDEQV